MDWAAAAEGDAAGGDRPSGSRTLGPALSLSLHLLAVLWLLMVPVFSDGDGLSAGVVVELVPEQIKDPDPPPPEPEPEPVRPKPAAAAKPMRAPATPPRLGLPEMPAREPVVDPPSEPQAAATFAVPPAGSGPGRSAEHDDALRRYGARLWEQIVRHKPRGVRTPGTAVVTFVVAGDGSLISAAITGPSGNPVLDETALAVVQRAAPFPPPPAGATPDQLSFAIPFQFR